MVSGKIHVIGNPPFGRQSSTAIKFIKHCGTFADSISFILPISFKKQFNISKIPKKFHLVFERTLKLDSFVRDGLEFSVPTIFNCEKKQFFRTEPEKAVPKGFVFVEKKDASFAICRTGNAGFATTNFANKSESHNYFIKLLTGVSPNKIVDCINKIYISERDFTVGAPSVSKQEIIPYLNNIINGVYNLK